MQEKVNLCTGNRLGIDGNLAYYGVMKACEGNESYVRHKFTGYFDLKIIKIDKMY